MRKRHEVDGQKLEVWRMAFDTSHDFFDETGLDPHKHEPPHGSLRGAALAAAEAHFLAAMRDAWEQVGADFLEEPKGPLDRDVPFALFAFGDPARPKRPRRSLQELRTAHFAIWHAAVCRAQRKAEEEAGRRAGVSPAMWRGPR
jgi:hypothetical protein